MPRRSTRKNTYVRLPEQRIQEIQDLVRSWPFETKAFMRARLNQYKPPSGWFNTILEFMLGLIMETPDRTFRVLKDPRILTDWQKRFELSGQSNPQEAWNRILEKEVTARDYRYLLSLLDTGLSDVHMPVELEKLLRKSTRPISARSISRTRPFPKRPWF